MPTVSIIVPNYCHGAFLRERLESIFAQDYPDYEVILLDDASSDNSLEVMRQYEGHDRVKALLTSEKNSGCAFVQWQRGMALAEGRYIWIAESDDVADPRLLSTLIDLLEQDDRRVMAYAASEWIDAQGQPIGRHNYYPFRRPLVMDGSRFAARYLMGYNHVCNASAVVFRRAAVASVDTRYSQYRASGDRMFWTEIARQGDVCYTPERLNRFRQHAQKVSGPASKTGQNLLEDHAIYEIEAPRLALTPIERRLACGYQMRALDARDLMEEGRQKALDAWKVEPELTVLSYLMYLLRHAMDRIR